MFKNRAARRRNDQIMAAARYMVDGLARLGPLDVYDVQLTPKSVATLAWFRHDIQVTPVEARDALGAALTERGYGLDRMTTTFDR